MMAPVGEKYIIDEVLEEGVGVSALELLISSLFVLQCFDIHPLEVFQHQVEERDGDAGYIALFELILTHTLFR